MISYNTTHGFVPWCGNDECFMNQNLKGFRTEEQAAEAWNRRASND